MTQEEKNLLLKDLCARLPYGVIMTNRVLTETYYPLDGNEWQQAYYDNDWDDVPYLRPMSSMTEEEYNFVYNGHAIFWVIEDYCNKHHLDYRGLIEKGLAIEVNKNNNPYIV